MTLDEINVVIDGARSRSREAGDRRCLNDSEQALLGLRDLCARLFEAKEPAGQQRARDALIHAIFGEPCG